MVRDLKIYVKACFLKFSCKIVNEEASRGKSVPFENSIFFEDLLFENVVCTSWQLQ